jgi:hypothetical protein
MEQIAEEGEIDPRVEAVNEMSEPARIANGIELPDEPGWTGSHRIERGLGTAVDLLDVAIGEGGGHEPGDLAVFWVTISVGNAEGAGRQEVASAVAAIEIIKELLELCPGAHRSGSSCGMGTPFGGLAHSLPFSSFA